MNKLDEDPLRGAFASYRYTTMVWTPGLAAITAGAKRRRLLRAARVATSVVVLVILPALVYALVAPAGKADIPLGPLPTPTAIGSEMPNPSGPVDFGGGVPSPVQVPTGTVPPGGLTPDGLRNATIDIPAWNATSYPRATCASGPTKFTDGKAPQGNRKSDLQIQFMGYVDVDGDRSFETIAKLTCPQAEAGPEQIVVVNSKSEVRGQVITSADGVQQIEEVIGMSDGDFRVLVNNNALCCGRAYTSAQHQWRSFHWNGKGFSQSFGSALFNAEAADADIKVILGELVFEQPVNGVRKGSLSVTVENAGANTIPGALIALNLRNVEPGDHLVAGPRAMPSMMMWELKLQPGIRDTIMLQFVTRENDAGKVGVGVIAMAQRSNAYMGGFSDLLRDKNPRDNEGDGPLTGVQAVVRMTS